MAIDSSTPHTTMNRSTASSLANSTSSKRTSSIHRQFRTRRTRAADLDAIATLLATESVPSRDTWNWNVDKERLRAKSILKRQLSHRLAAVEEGRETINRLCAVREDSIISDVDTTCHLLWKNDNLRSKIKTAVAYSQEESAWLFHNFDQPPSSDLLNHAMISIEDMSIQGVVGFCEVAWFPAPPRPRLPTNNSEDNCRRVRVSEHSFNMRRTQSEVTLSSHLEIPTTNINRNDEADPACAPAIVNLVISPSHRRKGIASRLLNFASKYAQAQWGFKDNGMASSLGLFVHPMNEPALRLYMMRGFYVFASGGENNLMYLKKRQ